MHWLKTKIKHILYNNFTDREFTKFMKIRALTCQLGEIPKDYQIATICPQKTYESICKRLANEGQTLSEVLQKDIEDASEVEEKREYWKRKKRQQREKQSSVQGDKLGQSQHKIRVDKIRLDKNKYRNPSLKEIEVYIKQNRYNISAESFFNYYESNGWKVGKNKMKDWRAAVRGWVAREGKEKNGTNKRDAGTIEAANSVINELRQGSDNEEVGGSIFAEGISDVCGSVKSLAERN